MRISSLGLVLPIIALVVVAVKYCKEIRGRFVRKLSDQ